MLLKLRFMDKSIIRETIDNGYLPNVEFPTVYVKIDYNPLLVWRTDVLNLVYKKVNAMVNRKLIVVDMCEIYELPKGTMLLHTIK